MLTEVCVFTLATTNTCDLAALTSLVTTANQVGYLYNSLQLCLLKDVTIATVCVVSDPCVRKKCSATCSTNGVNCTCVSLYCMNNQSNVVIIIISFRVVFQVIFLNKAYYVSVCNVFLL